MKRRDSFEIELDELLDEIYELSGTKVWDDTDLARVAGLSKSTVYRIGNRITRLPRFRTIQKLGAAVGLRVVFEQRLRVARHKAG